MNKRRQSIETDEKELEELIAVVRINNDFVTYIVNVCGKRGYVITHVLMFRFYLFSEEDDNGADVEYDCDDSGDDYDVNPYRTNVENRVSS